MPSEFEASTCQTLVRMFVAVTVASLVKNRVVRVLMAVSLLFDTGLLVWMRSCVRRLNQAQTAPPPAAGLGGNVRDRFGVRISLGPRSPRDAMLMWENPAAKDRLS